MTNTDLLHLTLSVLAGAWLGAVLAMALHRIGLARDLLLLAFSLGLGGTLGLILAAAL